MNPSTQVIELLEAGKVPLIGMAVEDEELHPDWTLETAEDIAQRMGIPYQLVELSQKSVNHFIGLFHGDGNVRYEKWIYPHLEETRKSVPEDQEILLVFDQLLLADDYVLSRLTQLVFQSGGALEFPAHLRPSVKVILSLGEFPLTRVERVNPLLPILKKSRFVPFDKSLPKGFDPTHVASYLA